MAIGPRGELFPCSWFLDIVTECHCAEHFRLDPKYRWLWDFQHGVAHGVQKQSMELSELLEIVQFAKLPKGDLDQERKLIDLEHVESRQALISDDVPTVDTWLRQG